jgi:hypothetical protein
MSKNLVDDVTEYLLSQLPEDVLTHLANAEREFLRAFQECVNACVDRTIAEVDVRVAGAKAKRDARHGPSSSRVTVEDEDATTSQAPV